MRATELYRAAGNCDETPAACSALTARGKRLAAVGRQRRNDARQCRNRLAFRVDDFRKAATATAIDVELHVSQVERRRAGQPPHQFGRCDLAGNQLPGKLFHIGDHNVILLALGGKTK